MSLLTRILSIASLCLGLAACFTSEAPLIGPEDAVFPFERIVFGRADEPDDRQTMNRKGDAYSFRPDESDAREAQIRLRPAGENLYVVQMEASEGGESLRLYGLLKVDIPAMRASTYAGIRPDNFVDAPGLATCNGDVCIQDIDAYVAYARGLMHAGVEPENEYRLIALE